MRKEISTFKKKPMLLKFKVQSAESTASCSLELDSSEVGGSKLILLPFDF
jgi:hypothetical protein